MKLSLINSLLGLPPQDPEIEISGISIDTRKLKKGNLFVALKGDQFNGHDFIEDAVKNGAAAVMVSDPIDQKLPCSILQTNDTLETLTELAKNYRKTFNIPVIGLTGSCGKTTTKSLIASILNQIKPTLSTEGTLNNHIGVPLTLMRLTPEHEYAVIEMGANHQKEISALTQIAQPTTALITNIRPVHLEGFGGIKGIVKGKSEIFEGLSGSESTAIINEDEPYAGSWKEMNRNRSILTFGLQSKADISASQVKLNTENKPKFTLHTPKGDVEVQLQITGGHQVMNALAAATATFAENISLEKIKKGLEALPEVDRRLCKYPTSLGGYVMDDSYNANPASTLAALKVLKQAKGRRIFVFADMLELGSEAEKYHLEVGETTKEMGIEYLFTYGELAQHAQAAFGENAYHFSNKEDLTSQLKDLIDEETTVLVKGSNGMKMWEIVSEIRSA